MSLNKAVPGLSSNFDKKGEGKTAFVTGGGGRLGRSLINALQREGYSVKALSSDKNFMHKMPRGVVPYVGDITDKKLLLSASKGADVVYHLAAIVSEYKAKTNELIRVNVQGTANVLEACRTNGVAHLVYASSVDVYGSNRDELLNEESATKPNDKYGYSKTLAEKEVISYADKLDYTIFRMAAIYGREFAAPYFKMFRAVREGKAYIIGEGDNNLAIVHIDDVVNAYLLAESQRRSNKNLYNLSDGVNYTQAGLLNMVADMLKVPRPSRHISSLVVRLLARRRNLDSDELRFIMSNRRIDISKIKKELGFRPSVKIEEGGMELVKEFVTKGNK